MSKLGIGTGITPDDGNGDSLLEGAVKVNSNFNELYSYFGDGTNLTSGSWQKVSSGINTTLNVGIGTTNPRFALEVGAVGASGTSLYVNGDARVTGILTVGSSSISLDGSNNILKVGTGVTVYGNTGIVSATSFYASGLQVGVVTASTIIYEGSVLYNAWQETLAGINTLSNVGIGTTNPTSKLTVKGTSDLQNVTVSGVSTFSGNTSFRDNNKILLGNDGDFEIYFDSSNTILQNSNTNSAGDLYIRSDSTLIQNFTGSETLAQFNSNGAVSLYYDNLKKFETIGTGVTVTGTTFTDQLSVSGVSTFGSGVNFGSALQIGTNSIESLIQSNSPSQFLIRNSAGPVNLRSNEINLISDPVGSPEYLLRGFGNGAVELYYDNSKKFETIGTGVTVTGTTFTDQLSVSGVSTFNNTINTEDILSKNISANGHITIKNTGTELRFQDSGGNAASVRVGDESGGNAYTSNNVFVGYRAGYSGQFSNNSQNTFIGAYAGNDLVTSYGNVIIGRFDGITPELDLSYSPTNSGYIVLANGLGDVRMVVDPSGNTGIGTTNPTSKLTVRDGDISVGVSTAHGVILTSPNGTQYRLIVDDSGALSTVAV